MNTEIIQHGSKCFRGWGIISRSDKKIAGMFRRMSAYTLNVNRRLTEKLGGTIGTQAFGVFCNGIGIVMIYFF